MTYDVMGPGALDYLPCRYGASKLLFRGPRRKLDEPYLAFLGGTETYGRFIPKPFSAVVEDKLRLPCVNFGCLNAGLDVFVYDPFVSAAAARAKITVLQIMGAQNMANRYYSVHPRRNDRFVAPTALLKSIFREIDFSEFHFNKHMLTTLKKVSFDRFKVIHDELQLAWVARMRLLMGQIGGDIVLLWFAEHLPPQDSLCRRSLGSDPLFITHDMIDQVAVYASKVVKVIPSRIAKQEGTVGMQFAPLEAHIAAELPGVRAHAEVATALVKAIGDMQ
jgi:hypothetical protein